MELRDYLAILRKHGWIILVVMVITIASAFVFSKLQTPVYRATVYLNVIPARLDWGLQQTVKGLMRNYAGNITSRKTAMDVIMRLELDITPSQLAEKLTVSPIEEDFLIQIDADDYDPVIAQNIAQTTAEVFVEDIKKHMLDQDKRDRVDVTLRDNALPGSLHKPKLKINLLAGALFGALVGGLVVFFLEWLEADILRTREDVESYTGVAVLGVIPTLRSSNRISQA
ncbi:MAG: Wzz/FepE/Etk N-terminal domain-containing protein [Chloroflexota bacterium]|nr:Wzz/FepE/Etk N-terminal domain-containing protein [Chloroflexota bacterium]